MNYIHTIKIYENSQFCWKYSKREKTIDDYKKSEWVLIFASVLWSVAYFIK